MGEICSIFRMVDEWLWPSENETAEVKSNENGVVQTKTSLPKEKTNGQPDALKEEDHRWNEGFLTDEPKLRDLLLSTPNERDLYEIVCAINQLLFFHVIFSWISLEVWVHFGDGPFFWNWIMFIPRI